MYQTAVFLLHNGELDRLQYLKPRLEKLCAQLECPIFEVSEAKLNRRLSLVKLLNRHIKNLYFEVLWNSRNGKSFPTEVWKQLRRFIHDAQNRQFRIESKLFKRLICEDEVFRKHLKILEIQLKTGVERSLVFESDVILQDERNLVNIMNTICEQAQYDKSFFLFSTPYTISQLGITKKITERSSIGDSEITRYDKLFTNTLASYSISCQLATLVYAFWKQRSTGLLPPSDWGFNQAFLTIESNNDVTWSTMHVSPELCLNGSLTGNYESGISK